MRDRKPVCSCFWRRTSQHRITRCCVTHLCTRRKGRTRGRQNWNGCTILELSHNLSSSRLRGIWDWRSKHWRGSLNNCLAILPQAFLWGSTCAALTCRGFNYAPRYYLILSCNCESLITVNAAVTQHSADETNYCVSSKRVDGWLFMWVACFSDNTSLSVRWLRCPLEYGIQ